MAYSQFFKQLTDFDPYPWQQRFAAWKGKIAVVNAPTGTGKEAGATIPWLFGHQQNDSIPRRLIYCLPTRSLVDQVYSNLKTLVERSKLSVEVYCLKGGQIEQGYEDRLTHLSILVGTQDQLLSRALNRGYATAWSQRPKHAAAVNNDCRWILDETQLMGVGYSTAVQLHKLRQELKVFGRAELVLMSATQDLTPVQSLPFDYYELKDEDHQHPYLGKKLTKPKPVAGQVIRSAQEIAEFAAAKHRVGGLTLVVLNTVKRVREVGEFLGEREIPILVIHSQFLGFDRERLQSRLYNFTGIVVATQVVEAGVDLDADVLITELCPWSSFVQRVGRCGRTDMNKASYVYWLDWQVDWSPLPYKKEECINAKRQLENLIDVGLLSLSAIEMPKLDLPSYLLGKREILQFFNTHPQLRNSRYSVTEYVRDPYSFTARVFWADKLPKKITIPHQRYLCPVPVRSLKTLITAQQIIPNVWREDEWRQSSEVEVGDVVCLPYAAGGYSHQQGWTGNSQDIPTQYKLSSPQFYDFDPQFPHCLSLKVHSGDAAHYMQQYGPLLGQIGLDDEDIDLLVQCAQWHDWGKAHEIWQQYAQATGEPVAKSDSYGNPREMNGYRHELASAIAAAQQGAPFIVQYLIATHHGKVRETLFPVTGQFDPNVLRGVPLGSSLPAVELGNESLDAVTLSYSSARNWDKQVKELLESLGPFRLWYLETLIRNADVEASNFREKEAKNATANSDKN